MAKCPKNIFITGANRGLGLEMVKQLLQKYKPQNIFATYRDLSSAKELQELAKQTDNPVVHLVQLDVRDINKFSEVANHVDRVTNGKGINLLINNAGVFKEGQSFQQLTKQTLVDYLEVNTFGAIFLTQQFEFLLEKGSNSAAEEEPLGLGRAVVVNFTSRLGSIADNSSGDRYASRCSRAALNAATKSMSIDLLKKKILAILMNPGWVRTDQGGEEAPLAPEDSVRGILNVIDNVTESQNGHYLQYDGKEIPW